MKLLFIRSYFRLMQIDLLMHFDDLQSIHALMYKSTVKSVEVGTAPALQDICHALDLACVCYFKRILCLQRSAATTLLLRQYGHKAEMVIGAQMLPFKSHAWVEVNGAVVNDKPYMLDIYRVLERC